MTTMTEMPAWTKEYLRERYRVADKVLQRKKVGSKRPMTAR